MLFYRKYGDPKNQPIVILHGVLGLSDNWDNFAKRFAEQGFYVIVPDMRNHGQSPRYETFNYTVMARDVKKVLDYEHVTHCYVIGHSMGGKIAILLAFENPQLVERLEVLDISPRKFDHPLQHLEFISAMGGVDLKHVQRRADVEEQLEKYHFEKRVLLFLMKNLSFSHEHGFRWKPYLKAIYKNITEISKGLEDKGIYEGPTLFVRGGKSDYIVDKDIDQIQKQFTDYQLVTLPESGHWIHVDDPAGFMRETEKFLLHI